MVFVVLGVLIAVSFYFSMKALQNLHIESSMYYDFGRYFPNVGGWVVVFYIVAILLLVGFLFFFAKIGFKSTGA